jgi:hypothetical protein
MISIAIDKSKDFSTLKETIRSSAGLLCSFNYPDGAPVPDSEIIEKASGKSYIPGEVMLFDSARIDDLIRRLNDALGLNASIHYSDGSKVPDNITINEFTAGQATKPEAITPANMTVSNSFTAMPTSPLASDTDLKIRIERAWNSTELIEMAKEATAVGNTPLAQDAYTRAFSKIFSFSDYQALFDSIFANMKDYNFTKSMIEEIERRAYVSSDKEMAAAYRQKFGFKAPVVPEPVIETKPAIEPIQVNYTAPVFETLPVTEISSEPIEEPKSVETEEDFHQKMEEMFKDSETNTYSDDTVEVTVTPEEQIIHVDAVNLLTEEPAAVEVVSELATPAETPIDEIEIEEMIAEEAPKPIPQDAATDYSAKSFEELRHIAAAIYEFDGDEDKAKEVFYEAEKKAAGPTEYFRLAKTISNSTADMDYVKEIMKKAGGLSKDVDELLAMAGFVLDEYDDKNWAALICRLAERNAFDAKANKKVADFMQENF